LNRKCYLAFCVLGVALPYSQFIPWVMQNGLHLRYFVQQLFANRVGGFFGMDVLVSAAVLFCFVGVESKRLHMHRLWLPIIATLAVGVSLGFPLFLYIRERALDSPGFQVQ
jgi:Terpene cyclase DEP1